MRPYSTDVLSMLRRSGPRGDLQEERGQVQDQTPDGRVSQRRSKRQTADRRSLHRGRDGRPEEVLQRGGRPRLYG